MELPQDSSEDPAEDEGKQEEGPRFGHTDQAHQDKSDGNHPSDGMTRPFSGTIGAEGNQVSGRRQILMRGRYSQ